MQLTKSLFLSKKTKSLIWPHHPYHYWEFFICRDENTSLLTLKYGNPVLCTLWQSADGERKKKEKRVTFIKHLSILANHSSFQTWTRGSERLSILHQASVSQKRLLSGPSHSWGSIPQHSVLGRPWSPLGVCKNMHLYLGIEPRGSQAGSKRDTATVLKNINFFFQNFFFGLHHVTCGI